MTRSASSTFLIGKKLTLRQGGNLHSKLASINFRRTSSNAPSQHRLDSRRLVNVIIAKEFNLAKEDVQIQTLEVDSSC
jgi:hypothetical protein